MFQRVKTPGIVIARRRPLVGPFGKCICTLWLAFFAHTWGATHAAARQLQDHASQQLISYLEKHQLDAFALAYLQESLKQTRSRDERLRAARALAHYYMRKRYVLDSEVVQDHSLIQLLNAFPELNEPAFELARMNAQYRLNKSQFQSWIETHRDERLRQQLLESWTDFREGLERHIQATESSITRMIDPETTADTLSQSLYLRAWTLYYLGLVNGTDEEQMVLFNAAIDAFRQLLGFAPNDALDQVDSSWLDLSLAWNARCLIGLGMSAEAANDLAMAQQCFQRLDSSTVDPDVFLERQEWRFNSYFFPGKIAAAASFAGQLLADDFTNPLVWNSIVIAGRVWPEPDDAEARRMTLLGLAGLAKANRFDQVAALMDKYKIQMGSESLLSSWISAQLAYDRYIKNQSHDDLLLAEASIARALEFAELQHDENIAAQVLWLQALISIAASGPSAAELFGNFAKLYRFKRPELASRALWMQIQLLDSEPSSRIQYSAHIASAEVNLKRWFPESRYVKLVEYRRIRQQLTRLDVREAIQMLESIDVSDPNYEMARYDLVQAYFRKWKQLSSDGGSTDATAIAESKRLLHKLEEQVNNFLRNFPQSPAHYRVSCGLMMVDAMLKQTPPDLLVAHGWLQQMQPLADQLEHQNPAKADFHYYQLTVAEARNDIALGIESAQWLIDNATTPQTKTAGLVWQIRQIEANVEQPMFTADRSVKEHLCQLYTQLIDMLDNDTVELSNAPALRTAMQRAAELNLDLNNYRSAAEYFNRLLLAFPRNQRFLIGAARANDSMGQTDAALEAWRVLARGAEAGSEIWFEAKYRTIVAIIDSDPNQARILLEQTLQLAPDVPEPWQNPFKLLRERLKSL
ncbi:MAG TPA: hypothetical protein PKD64_05700 [Pirellulaceae bacterium]|nr:hypothetical protein [Pirellulaceae bacterium]HMO91673.1 hypothetical protein [Pirellulaceae bacterium]HMP68370.1 hypothetical protein [Pirellulaceae bacterium]